MFKFSKHFIQYVFKTIINTVLVAAVYNTQGYQPYCNYDYVVLPATIVTSRYWLRASSFYQNKIKVSQLNIRAIKSGTKYMEQEQQ